MTKPRVRLQEVRKCHNGQRAWQWVALRPITIITLNRKRDEAVYHVGHEFDIQAQRLRLPGWMKVWAIVG